MKLFENTEAAFKLKSDSELERAHFLFKLIQNEPMVRIGTAVTNFALSINLPIEGLIRSTVFDQFCGGVSEEDCMPNIEKMYAKAKVSSVLDYSVEDKQTEESFDEGVQKVLNVISFSQKKESIPFAVFKPSGFGRFQLFQKITEGKPLREEEKEEWSRIVARFHLVCKTAYEKNVPVLIDAEESWKQKAADDLVDNLMETYNKEKAIVFNTIQMYRKGRMEYLKELHQKASQKGFHIGMKVVRGAYMEKERERAEELGYPSPICDTKSDTDKNFNEAISYMIEHNNMAIFAGTHNEESSYLLLNLVKQHKIDISDNLVWFGQLYGMSDHISFNLADKGYNVAKYMPFGPVRDVMPYLIRRAEENTSVKGQTSRELKLLSKEIKRRNL